MSILLVGGDADDGPNVNERDNEDANTDPNPDPLRAWDCWSGDAAMETLWLGCFRWSAAMPRGRDMNGGVVPVEYGGVESRRQISLDERADVWGAGIAWTSLRTDEAGIATGGLVGIVDGTGEKSSEKSSFPGIFLAC